MVEELEWGGGGTPLFPQMRQSLIKALLLRMLWSDWWCCLVQMVNRRLSRRRGKRGSQSREK